MATAMRCNRCHRKMRGTTAYDGACACGGLIEAAPPPSRFTYDRWRHGGWYVLEVRYRSGAVGCVSRNYPDKKWRIVDDPRGFDKGPTFKSRDEAALAEWRIAQAEEVTP